jgi:hypothetical protein
MKEKINKLTHWSVIIIGFLLLPPVNYYIDYFVNGFLGPKLGGMIINVPTWIISILILIIGIKGLVKKE